MLTTLFRWWLHLEYLLSSRLNSCLAHKISLLFHIRQFLAIFLIPEPFINTFEIKLNRFCKTFDLLFIPFARSIGFNEELLHGFDLFFCLFLQFKAFSTRRCLFFLFDSRPYPSRSKMLLFCWFLIDDQMSADLALAIFQLLSTYSSTDLILLGVFSLCSNFGFNNLLGMFLVSLDTFFNLIRLVCQLLFIFLVSWWCGDKFLLTTYQKLAWCVPSDDRLTYRRRGYQLLLLLYWHLWSEFWNFSLATEWDVKSARVAVVNARGTLLFAGVLTQMGLIIRATLAVMDISALWWKTFHGVVWVAMVMREFLVAWMPVISAPV